MWPLNCERAFTRDAINVILGILGRWKSSLLVLTSLLGEVEFWWDMRWTCSMIGRVGCESAFEHCWGQGKMLKHRSCRISSCSILPTAIKEQNQASYSLHLNRSQCSLILLLILVAGSGNKMKQTFAFPGGFTIVASQIVSGDMSSTNELPTWRRGWLGPAWPGKALISQSSSPEPGRPSRCKVKSWRRRTKSEDGLVKA